MHLLPAPNSEDGDTEMDYNDTPDHPVEKPVASEGNAEDEMKEGGGGKDDEEAAEKEDGEISDSECEPIEEQDESTR